MKNRVYQLTVEEVPEDERFNAWDSQPSDFVADSWYDGDRKTDIQLLAEAVESHGATVDMEAGVVTFSEDFHINWFDERYRQLTQLVAGMSREEFATSGHPSKISELTEKSLDMYVYNDENELVPFDRFVRELEWHDSREFHLGGTVVYSF